VRAKLPISKHGQHTQEKYFDIISDGLKGILFYRGYDIGDLVSKRGFIDTQFLLLNGHLPSHGEKLQWQRRLSDVQLKRSILDVIRAFP
jgi:citrate synthase